MKRVKVGLPSIPTEVQNANILEIIFAYPDLTSPIFAA